MMRSLALAVTVLAVAACPAAALAAGGEPEPRPNFLWITAEDIGPTLGCYGHPDAVTPGIDRFAAAGVRFTNCFSVHPCCSPSRSCLATGVYPTRLGTFQHRGKMWVSADLVKCFPTLLREAGYYCFNGSKGGSAKLDYNFTPEDAPWDKVGSNEVQWRNRKPGQPFFGQINLSCTHQSQYGRRAPGTRLEASKSDERPSTKTPAAKRGKPAAEPVHDPAEVHVPPYHPDTPAVREIWADYHDRITQMDQQFGELLKQLEADDLAGDTIVFFFGDNGHGVPGGKIWLWDEGPHVPLVIRFPEKWQDWMPTQPGGVCDRLVSFLDFAPTMLSLAGLGVPEYMQGVAFLGPQAGPPRRYVFAARDFHDGADFDAGRMVRDRRYHYIRNFMPHIGWDAIQYSWKMAPFMLDQWRREAEAGKLRADTRQACFFRRTKPAEELYDVESDPYQMQNLAGDPRSREVLERMRAECERWMIENRDLGLLSQYELYQRSQQDSPLEMGKDPKRNPIRRLLEAANLANRADAAALPQLVALLKDEDAAVRRWGAIGLLALGEKAGTAEDALLAALADDAPDVRMTAAEALCGLGAVEPALPVLIELLGHESRIIQNETLLAFCRIGEPAKAALPHLENLSPQQSGKQSTPWSYDNVPDAAALARSCLGGAPPHGAAGKSAVEASSTPSGAGTKASRQKYLP